MYQNSASGFSTIFVAAFSFVWCESHRRIIFCIAKQYFGNSSGCKRNRWHTINDQAKCLVRYFGVWYHILDTKSCDWNQLVVTSIRCSIDYSENHTALIKNAMSLQNENSFTWIFLKKFISLIFDQRHDTLSGSWIRLEEWTRYYLILSIGLCMWIQFKTNGFFFHALEK